MIEIKDLYKKYEMGDTVVSALEGVTLTIEPGEFVAIMGPSGSGKSTLMHILGLLDVPSSGSYKLFENEVSRLSEDELAIFRRNTIGFIFQQFNLLSRTTALSNVVMPQLYSSKKPDLDKARALLEKVGLGSRLQHKSNELSGGQQQRVAIARSLINSPGILLADEPTGNLDSKSEKEIMGILTQLNQQGITVVVVTHEEEIAQHTDRVIRMRDGKIQSDERINQEQKLSEKSFHESEILKRLKQDRPSRFNFKENIQHFREGVKALLANKVRTGLSMLGILIGVAAVIAMLALGRGAQKSIETQLASLGSNLLVLRPGATQTGGVALEAGTVTRLTEEDATSLQESIPTVKRTAPSVSGRGQVVYENKNWNTQVLGASPDYADMRAATPDIGRFFTEEENQKRSLVAVLGRTVVRELFGDKDPIGEYIKINRINFQVIGVMPEKGATTFRDQDDVIVIPILTAMRRLLGKDYVDTIDIEADSAADVTSAQEAVKDLILKRHKIPPSQPDSFQIRNMADVQGALSESSRIMSFLLASIAGISLLVGGIGIMNIMLVSVTERTREIGLRKAVGARRWDILNQFLIEAVVVSIGGGIIGIILGWGTTMLMSKLAGWATSVSVSAIVLAFFFSGTIGIIFGIWPARKASLLNPIDALRYE
jgi:macrolide transport system ATP-binding/permease protein